MLSSRALLRLDLLEATQDLASQSFHQEDIATARRLADEVIEKLLATVRTASLHPDAALALGKRYGRTLRPRLHQAELRQRYLRARLEAALPKPITDELVKNVQDQYVLARGGDRRWNQRMDLALGQFLLRAALRGDGPEWRQLLLPANDNYSCRSATG